MPVASQRREGETALAGTAEAPPDRFSHARPQLGRDVLLVGGEDATLLGPDVLLEEIGERGELSALVAVRLAEPLDHPFEEAMLLHEACDLSLGESARLAERGHERLFLRLEVGDELANVELTGPLGLADQVAASREGLADLEHAHERMVMIVGERDQARIALRRHGS
jgi:hypothetical protein